MIEDLGDWPESFSIFLGGSMSNDGYSAELGDVGYDAVYPPHLPAVPVDLDGFLPEIISTDFYRTPSYSDTFLVHSNPYHPPLEHILTTQRQQPLHINTQLHPYQTSESGSSTASSTSLPTGLITPSHHLYPSLLPPIYIPSASTEKLQQMMDPIISPFPISPTSSSCSPMFGDCGFDLLSPAVLVEPGVVTQSQMPQIVEWKRVIELCGTIDFVPQVVYQPNTEADKKRYIRDVQLQKTIFFQLVDSPELGIPLDDALRQRLRNLKGKDDRMFIGCGPSISIRIQWPGYLGWSKQIPTKDFRRPKGPITRAKLAKNIATCVRRFTKEMQHKPMEAESDGSWKVGEQHIKVENLILVSLHHVSKGSWQPLLRVRSSFSRDSSLMLSS